MMERFAAELDLYGTADAVVLLTTLSGWQTIQPMLPDLTGISEGDFSDEDVVDDLKRFTVVLQVFLTQVKAARAVTYAYNIRVRRDIPADLFGDGADF